jgi:succinate-acetate transporter protein
MSVSNSDRLHPQPAVRVVVRPIGSVLPLGIMAFGLGASLTAAYSLGWIPVEDAKTLYTLLLVFVVPIQGVAAMFAVLSRDTPGATVLSIFGATWAALAITGRSAPPGSTSTTIGAFLIADSVLIALLAIAALTGNPAFSVILTVSIARFALNGVYQLTGHVGIERASGWVGLVLAAVAGYAGLAFLLEDGAQRPVLPMLRHGPSREAIESSFTEHIERIEREPGVRANL